MVVLYLWVIMYNVRQLGWEISGLKCMITVRTLTSVRHVPNLKKNLICLVVLDSDGYKFTG